MLVQENQLLQNKRSVKPQEACLCLFFSKQRERERKKLVMILLPEMVGY